MRAALLQLSLLLPSLLVGGAEPLPIDPLWKSESFRKSVTASYGIDSRIEPRITEDEAFYLDQSAEAMAGEDRAKAIEVLRRSSLLEDSPAMRFTLATLLFETGEPADAEESMKQFESALESFPNFRDAHRNLGVVLIRLGREEEARGHLVRALSLGSQDGLTAGLLAYCHARDGHHQAALDAYRLALITQPDESQWLLGEAQALMALERPREAASVLQSLIAASPDNSPAWLFQADAWIDQGEELRAAANLEIAYRKGALEADAIASLGHLYVQHGLADLAMERYEIAVHREPRLSTSRVVEIVEQFVASSDWGRAKTVKGWIEASPFHREALSPESGDRELVSRYTRARAVLELESGDTAAGAKLVEDWIRREPLDGLALLLLARFREEAGQTIEAAMLLEQAARIPKSAAAAHLAHGRLLVAAGDYQSALEHLEKSQELNPTESLARYVTAIRDLSGLK